MDPMYRITGLGRPVDPNYPTNRVIAVVTLLIMVLGTVYRITLGDGLAPSVSWGFGSGVAVFLAWALAREVDPDYELSAFVAAGLGIIGVLLLGLPGLLTLLGFMLILRAVNRSTGSSLTILDHLSLLGLTAWLVYQGNLVFGFMAALALLLDGWLIPPQRWSWLSAGLTLLLTLGLAILRPITLGPLALSLPVLAGVATITSLFLPVIVASRQVGSVCDRGGNPLYPRRIQAAQGVALAAAASSALLSGLDGVAALSPLWAALIGVFLYRLFVVFLRGQKPS